MLMIAMDEDGPAEVYGIGREAKRHEITKNECFISFYIKRDCERTEAVVKIYLIGFSQNITLLKERVPCGNIRTK